MIKYIIFDFDGTIADSFSLAIKCTKEIAKENHKDFNHLDFKDMKSKTIYEVIKDDFSISLLELPFYLKKIKKCMIKRYDEVKLFEGIKEVIQKLNKKYKIIILSSNYKEFIQKVLLKEKLDLEILRSSSLFGKAKTIKRFMKNKNLKDEELIYVGDEIRDIESCKKVNIKIISVSWGFNSKDLLIKYKPDYLIKHPKELLNIIQ